MYFDARDYDAVIEQGRKTVEIDPRDAFATVMTGSDGIGLCAKGEL